MDDSAMYAKRPWDRSAYDQKTFYSVEQRLYKLLIYEPKGAAARVREEIIQDIWAQQQFATSALTTTNGQELRVLTPGTINKDSGPDFSEARVVVDKLQWIGAVEVHRTSTGWVRHGHHKDPRYNHVILHVVLQEDEHTGKLCREDQTHLPELVLYPYLTAPLRRLLHQFYRSSRSSKLYCKSLWQQVPPPIRRRWIQTLGRERLQAKKKRLAKEYLVQADRTKVLYRYLFRALGYAKNSQAMMDLTERLPLDKVRRYTLPLDLEALYLGMAGFLPTGKTTDAFDERGQGYLEQLTARYQAVAQPFDRRPMEPMNWKFFRLRPANFPTLRLAQGAALLHSGRLLHQDSVGQLTDAVAADQPVEALRALLRVPLPAFWRNHLRLDRLCKPRNPVLGRRRADTLCINVLLPFLLLCAKQENNPALAERVEQIYRQFPAVSDRITRIFEKQGARPANRLEAQGLHQLYRTRCTEGRCLQCAIGSYVLDR